MFEHSPVRRQDYTPLRATATLGCASRDRRRVSLRELEFTDFTQEVRVRLKVFTVVFGFAMASIAVAQSSGDIAYFHVNRVKPGMTSQYETARKRHWVWHRKMQDKWVYHVWQIVSGEASGTYMVCSFGHTWKEVDESDQLVGGEEDDPAAKVEPYLDAEPESYYRYLPNLSIARKDGFSPSAKLAVTRFLVKQEDVETFLAVQAKMKDALAKAGHLGNLRWFELVNGGETPQFLMLVDRDNWASYEHSENENLGSIMEKTYGKDQAASMMRDVRRAVRSQYVETWQYRPDLSFVPAVSGR